MSGIYAAPLHGAYGVADDMVVVTASLLLENLDYNEFVGVLECGQPMRPQLFRGGEVAVQVGPQEVGTLDQHHAPGRPCVAERLVRRLQPPRPLERLALGRARLAVAMPGRGSLTTSPSWRERKSRGGLACAPNG